MVNCSAPMGGCAAVCAAIATNTPTPPTHITMARIAGGSSLTAVTRALMIEVMTSAKTPMG